MIFFPGLHDLHVADRVPQAFISVNRLRRRKGADFPVRDWICDSAAFTELSTHGRFRHGVEEYAAEVRKFAHNGRLLAIVAQDYMCEPWILKKTGLTLADHQRLTIERYDALLEEALPAPVMPVLQGYWPDDYVRHIRLYGPRLTPGQWVGVGSVCKRNGSPKAVRAVLEAIRAERPDLRLHGFGLKQTALTDRRVRQALYSADSLAWSYHARRNGLDRNGWREAAAYSDKISEAMSIGKTPQSPQGQLELPIGPS